MSALDLVLSVVLSVMCAIGMLFNLRLLVICLKGKAKCTLIQKSRPVAVFQLCVHLVFLAMSAAEAILNDKSSEQRGELCGISKVLQISSGDFAFFNFATLLVIEYQPHIFPKQELSSKMAGCMALAMGFLALIDSGLQLLCGCLTEQFRFACMFVSLIINLVPAILLLFTTKEMSAQVFNAGKYSTAKKSSTPRKVCCAESDATSTVCGIYLLFLFGMIIMYVVNSFSGYLTEEFRQANYIRKMIYLFVMSYVVGIGLPLALKLIIDPRSDLHNECHEVININSSI